MALYTKKELNALSLAELKKLAAKHEIELEKGWKKADLVTALYEVPEPELEDEDEVEEELDDELEEEEDEEELEPELPEEEEEDEVEEKPAKKSKAKTKPKNDKGEDTIAAKQVATIISGNLGTPIDAKTLRQFFRSPASTVEAVGSGGRYEFLETDVPKIQKEFEAWRAGHASRGSKRTGGKKSSHQIIEEVEEVEEIEELDLSDEDLDDLEEDDLELEDED